jgi:hypothetical protein
LTIEHSFKNSIRVYGGIRRQNIARISILPKFLLFNKNQKENTYRITVIVPIVPWFAFSYDPPHNKYHQPENPASTLRKMNTNLITSKNFLMGGIHAFPL